MNYSDYKLTIKELDDNKEYYFQDPTETMYSGLVIKKDEDSIYLAHYNELENGEFEIEKILDDEATCYKIGSKIIDLCPDIFERDFYSLNIAEFYDYCFAYLYERSCDLSKGIPAKYKMYFQEIKADSIFTFHFLN